MKHMILIHNDPALEPAHGTPAFDAMMGGFFAANEKIGSGGILVSGKGLQGIETATSLRIRGDKAMAMDGPFATTGKYPGGYYVVNVPDLDAALKYAAVLPSATWGTIEVRPLMDYNPTGN